MYIFDHVIYHLAKPKVNCPDGIAAAWVCHKYNPEARILGMSYGEDLPELPDGCSVMCVDFSFSRDQLAELRSRKIRVTIIDHHVSAFELLTSLEGQIVNRYIKDDKDKINLLAKSGNWLKEQISNSDDYRYLYDISECGATLTWRALFPDKPIPPFLYYIKDRDLWEHKLPKTKEMYEAFSLLRRNFETFDYLAELSEQDLIESIAPIGEEQLLVKQRIVDRIGRNVIKEVIAGYEVVGIELKPKQARWTSDIAENLYKRFPDSPFVFCKGTSEENRVKYSLRSATGSGLDVAKIAEKYGGGGHKHAAGFVLESD